jgi:glycosyltransferase involved in cell wall biosynthesis
MSWQQERAHALQERCRTVCTALGIDEVHDARFVRAVLDRFLPTTSGPDAERAWSTVAYVLTQAFHCRVPMMTTTQTLRSAYEAGSIKGLHRMLVEHEWFRTSPQAAAALVTVGDARLAVDVSETARIPFTTGIQRVVRSIARHLPDTAPGSMLVRWSERTQGFTPLTEDEVTRLLSAEPPRTVEPPPSESRSSAISAIQTIQRAALWPTRELERTIRRQRQKAHSKRPVQPSVFLWNDALLLPELVVGEDHVDAVRFVSGATPVRSTFVFYDAIPIRHPEYFAEKTLAVYLRSLSLARDVSMVSCISHTVREHLEGILTLMPARRLPRLAVHALGADLPTHEKTVPASFDRPAVLCVGTVEPRKNHLRILEAMRIAQHAGSRFTGVFVGNAGWLNGRFRSAFTNAKTAGHDLVLRENVSNAELRGLYDAAAFTIYCSLDEGFGLPIIESLRHGCPCITSDRGSMREVAEQTRGCLTVDPEDVSAIAAAISSLVDEPKTLARLTREAEKAEWPTWRAYTEELVQFAREPASGATRRRRAA